MDHEGDSLLERLLLSLLRVYVIRVIAGLIIVVGIGFWQLIVTVADHQRGQSGDGLTDGPCRASTSDAAGCRLPPREAD
jgi:hypothetical protein